MKRYLISFSIFIILALLVDFRTQLFIVPVVLLAILYLNPQSIKILCRWKFLLFLTILVFGVPIFAGDKNASFMGISYSVEIFRMSLVMASRSIIILMSVKMLTQQISVSQMAGLMEKIHLKNFSHIFSISMSILPDIRNIASQTLEEHRKKIKFKNMFSEIFGFMVSIIVRILNFAENYHNLNYRRDES